MLNSPGTIDEGYRGEVGVVLVNHGSEVFRIDQGTRIGQLVIQRRLHVDVVEGEDLGETEAGRRRVWIDRVGLTGWSGRTGSGWETRVWLVCLPLAGSGQKIRMLG